MNNMSDEKRLKAFESMLEDVKNQMEFAQSEMDKLKAQGREKSVTFKQHMSNKLMYQRILSMYKKHGLLS
ncbi:hypothetical protein HGI81_01610 [Olsenella sp. KGMB02461]|nr:hypothetical protein [Olsenella sp. KGMB02461]